MQQASDRERQGLFTASCVGIVATAMCFGIRADIMDALSAQFHLSNEQVGWIAGTAFWGFTLSMLLGGQLCDLLGMKRIIQFAFLAHLAGVAVTICANGFVMLFGGTLAVGLANGFFEAAANPLTATLYPDNKTERLNRLHVWFPGGIVIGGLVGYFFTQLGLSWQWKTATILLPTLAYGALFFARHLPATERVQNHVTTSSMYRQALRPGFLVLLVCILLTAATELGPNQWIPSILTKTTGLPGIIILVWITGLMAVGRRFAGSIVSRMAPTALLIGSTILASAGLLALGLAQSTLPVMLAATVYALGVCYCWPTMYGITAERFPAGGAFLLAVIGSAGMLSDAFVVPLMGRMYDLWGPGRTLTTIAILPALVSVIFAAIWLHDRAHGGYRVIHLQDRTDGGVTPDIVASLARK